MSHIPSIPSHAPPLRGIRILDFTQNLPGPYASVQLAAMGAEVIKVEPPSGDSGRILGPLFKLVNSGKKSIVVDLKNVDERAKLERLLPQVDIILEGFRPGVMESFGLGSSTLRQRDPQLIYCSMSGFGQDGPYRRYPGHDLNFQALTGICHMLRDAHEHPQGSALPLADLSSGLSAVAAITAALYGRQVNGHGCHIDIALTDTVLSWAYLWTEGLTPSDTRLSDILSSIPGWIAAQPPQSAAIPPSIQKISQWLRTPKVAAGVDQLGHYLTRLPPWRHLVRLRLYAFPHYAIYRTRDNRWLSIAIVDERKFWLALCEGLAFPKPLQRSLANIPLGGRLLAAGPLRKIIAYAFSRRSLDDWLRTLNRAHVPVTPVLRVDQAIKDPQLVSRLEQSTTHPTIPAPFANVSLAPTPYLGQHTAEILDSVHHSSRT